MGRIATALALVLACVLACGTSHPSPPDPDVPPEGSAALAAWIGSGYYKAWTCEPAPHIQVFPSNHGYNRTCNNPILHEDAAGTGPFPVDAASVKELYDDCGVNIIGYAVSKKVAENAADEANWYWYQAGGNPAKYEDGTGSSVGDCIGCHQCAPRDFTFAIVTGSGSAVPLD